MSAHLGFHHWELTSCNDKISHTVSSWLSTLTVSDRDRNNLRIVNTSILTILGNVSATYIVLITWESWTVKKAERQGIDAFELWCWRRLLRVPWTARRSNQSIPKEMFIGRTDAEAETPILWPPHAKSWLVGKGKDWGQEEKGTTEDEMAGWHHQLNGHVFE